MRKIQLYFVLLTLAFLAACTKEQADEQNGISYNDYSTSALDHSKPGYGCNNGSNDISSTANALVVDFDLTLDDGTIFEKEDLIITNKSSNAVSYTWDFGNGDKATGPSPSYEYKIHGHYTVTLTATDARGNTQTAERKLEVLCLFGGGAHDK